MYIGCREDIRSPVSTTQFSIFLCNNITVQGYVYITNKQKRNQIGDTKLFFTTRMHDQKV